MPPTDERVREMIRNDNHEILKMERDGLGDHRICELRREDRDALTNLLTLREAIRDVLDVCADDDAPDGAYLIALELGRKTGLTPRGEKERS